MTTIAWDGEVLAADSQITSGEMRVGHYRKIGKRGRVLFGASGEQGLAQRFIAWCAGGFNGDPPEMTKGGSSASGLVILGDRILTFSDTGIDTVHGPYYAQGSGSPFAYGALAAGATAGDAVRAAIKHDCGSGGYVTELRR